MIAQRFGFGSIFIFFTGFLAGGCLEPADDSSSGNISDDGDNGNGSTNSNNNTNNNNNEGSSGSQGNSDIAEQPNNGEADAGSGSETSNGNEEHNRVCDPGSVQICPCGNGVESTQVCDDDGLRWGNCECETSDVTNHTDDLPPDVMNDGGVEDGGIEQDSGTDSGFAVHPDGGTPDATSDATLDAELDAETNCVADCEGRECGSDGCEGTCSPGCGNGFECNDNLGICECVPQCEGRECGSDGCGGTCTPGCGDEFECNETLGICQCLAIDRVKVRAFAPAAVRVTFRVLNCNGYPLERRLNEEEFTVINDEQGEPFGAGQEGGGIPAIDMPSEFGFFSILALDMSDSIFNNDAVNDVIDGAKIFVQKMGGDPKKALQQKMALLIFGRTDATQVVLDFTDDAELLNEKLEELRTGSSLGTTNLYGAYMMALDEVMNQGTDLELVERSVVILTDGTHEAGNTDVLRQQALDAKQAGELESVTAFSIGIQGNYDESKLAELASNEQYFVMAENAEALGAVFENVAGRVEAISHSNYVVGVCTPVELGNPTMTIQVDVDGAQDSKIVSYSTEVLTGDVSSCDPVVVANPCKKEEIERECGPGLLDSFDCGGCAGEREDCNAQGQCACADGYIGVNCAECSVGYHDGGDGQCVPEGSCSDGYHDGGTGECIEIPPPIYCEDLEVPCSGNGYCENEDWGYVCICNEGFYDGGDGSCIPEGTCLPGYHDGGDGFCVLAGTCSPGYHDDGGGFCVENVACSATDTCSFHGICVDSSGMPACQCDEGYAGAICDACATEYHDGGDGDCMENVPCSPSDTCSNHGMCADSTGMPVCHCDYGYDGIICDTCAIGYHDGGDGSCVLQDYCSPGYHHDDDEVCVENVPCTASDTCSNHGICLDVSGMPVCNCDEGYAGEICNSCDTGYHDGGDGVCVLLGDCSSGYHDGGDGVCVENVACAATDICSNQGACVDTTGMPVCNCDQGYAGIICDACDTGYHDGGDGGCVLVSECSSGYHDSGAGACVENVACAATDTCSNHGTCIDTSGMPVCNCVQGYAGAICDACDTGYHDGGAGVCVEDVACAATDICSNHGTCVDTTGMPVCNCDQGYAGVNCDACDTTGYHDGGDGACVLLVECSSGYHNDEDGDCVENVACSATDTCSFHGTCVDTSGMPVCNCDQGYAGDLCDACDTGYQDDGDGACVLPLWVLIPGETFYMGNNSDSDSQPVHEVTVPGFEMMRTEVTVNQYQACVYTATCSVPTTGSKYNWGVAGRDEYPINGVNWSQAKHYCEWAGGRLPTEAEWEYAARSGGQNIPYPWGYETATCYYAVMDIGEDGCGTNSTWEICSKPVGNSAQGLCDLAGNVAEWVEDNYHADYIGAPTDGSAWVDESAWYHVSRGGSFELNYIYMHAARRGGGIEPSYDHYSMGIRCVRDVDICDTGYHDGGNGDCVLEGTCSTGYHDGGNGDCVLEGTCSTGYQDGGTGICDTCDTNYHDGGDGDCIISSFCSSGYHDGGDGVCVLENTCSNGYHDGGDGVCVEDVPCTASDTCSDHGTCIDTTGMPVCYCDEGYAGAICDTCDTGYYDGGNGECVPVKCGDGLAVDDEECDDSNMDDGDGCSSLCRLEPGFACETGGGSCHPTVCGDGVEEGSEQCDDGNDLIGDGCTPFCKNEPDCSGGTCVPVCGDGQVYSGEDCDDGNTRDGDGCSSICEKELGFTCVLEIDDPPEQVLLPVV
ncbi:MAG: SUMF1/EgtB/PvdO family nonheme iron enzyme, partial [Gammaproteobacteria bacterium]|nr:SUMF1/EgtB/PvdO family nonheme iron enzyme [Gammaproteobacteria bacterium]